jgi:hypothetical protein
MGATDAQQIALLKSSPVSPQERDKLTAEVAPDMTSSCLQSLSPPFGGLWEIRDPVFHWLAPVARGPPPLRGSCKPTTQKRWRLGLDAGGSTSKSRRRADALFNGLSKQHLHAFRLDKSAVFRRQRGQLHGLSFEVSR